MVKIGSEGAVEMYFKAWPVSKLIFYTLMLFWASCMAKVASDTDTGYVCKHVDQT